MNNVITYILIGSIVLTGFICCYLAVLIGKANKNE